MSADLHGLDIRALRRKLFGNLAQDIRRVRRGGVENDGDIAALFRAALLCGRGELHGDGAARRELDLTVAGVERRIAGCPGNPAAVVARFREFQAGVGLDVIYAVVVRTQETFGVVEVNFLAVFLQIVRLDLPVIDLAEDGARLFERLEARVLHAEVVLQVVVDFGQAEVGEHVVNLGVRLLAQVCNLLCQHLIVELQRLHIERDRLFVLADDNLRAALPGVNRVAAVDVVAVHVVALDAEVVFDEVLRLHVACRQCGDTGCFAACNRVGCRALAVVAAGDCRLIVAEERAERAACRAGHSACRIAVRDGRAVSAGLSDEAADCMVAAARLYRDAAGCVAVFHRAVQVADQAAHVESCVYTLYGARERRGGAAAPGHAARVGASDQTAVCAVVFFAGQRACGKAVLHRAGADIDQQTHVGAAADCAVDNQIPDHAIAAEAVKQTAAAHQTGNRIALAVERAGIRRAADGGPGFAAEVDAAGQLGIDIRTAAVDLLCEPCQLCGAGNLIGSVRALVRHVFRRAVPAGTGVGELDGDGLVAGDRNCAGLFDVVFLGDGVGVGLALHKGIDAVFVCRLRALRLVGHGDRCLVLVNGKGDLAGRQRLKRRNLDGLCLAVHGEGDIFRRLVAEQGRGVGVAAVRERVAAVRVCLYLVAVCVLDGDSRTLRCRREGDLRKRLGAEVLELDVIIRRRAVGSGLLIAQRQRIACRQIDREGLPARLVVSLQQRLIALRDGERAFDIFACRRTVIGEA